MNSNYYILGSDGSGKTTFLKEIESILASRGIKTRHIWIRSPKILSKPLMAYCRLVGLTKYNKIDNVKYGKHEFYKSPFVSWIFPYLQLIDFKIKWFIERRKIGGDEVVLFDRFNIDTLADLMVDTKNMNLHKTWVGRKILEMTPKESKMIMLFVEEMIIRKRKVDTLHDEHLSRKNRVYKVLSKDLNIKVIDNNREFEIVKREILKYINL